MGLCLVIMFTSGVMAIKMSKMTVFVLFADGGKTLVQFGQNI